MNSSTERNVFTPPAWELAAYVPLFEHSTTPPQPVPSDYNSVMPVQPQSERSVERFLTGQRPVQGKWAKRLASTAIIVAIFTVTAYMIWWQIPEVKTQAACYDWYVNKHPEQIGLLLMATQSGNTLLNITTADNVPAFNLTP